MHVELGGLPETTTFCKGDISLVLKRKKFKFPAEKWGANSFLYIYFLLQDQGWGFGSSFSTLMQIRIRIVLLIKVMQICDHWSSEPSVLHHKHPRLYCESQRPSTAPF
jgi:hypothetical protein